MPSQTIQCGTRINETWALQLAADLNLLTPDGDVTLDFGETRHFEPFGMLLVSSAINRLRSRMPRGSELRIPTSHLDAEGIAAHMGFWQSMGLPLGRAVNAPASKDSYLPITRIGVDDLYRESGGANPLAAGVVENRARQLANILASPKSASLNESLTYAIRELIRNVLEHAMTPAIWVAGMSWPRRDYVQVAVLDEGRGIRKSLADNPQFRYPSDIDALRAALRPGVSRNLGREPSPQEIQRFSEEGHGVPIEAVKNAGYGLHMISTLCREAGQFMIVSGTASIAFIGGAEVQSTAAHQGTALRLVLQPSEVPEAWEELFASLERGKKPMLSPSTLRRLGFGTLANKPKP